MTEVKTNETDEQSNEVVAAGPKKRGPKPKQSLTQVDPKVSVDKTEQQNNQTKNSDDSNANDLSTDDAVNDETSNTGSTDATINTEASNLGNSSSQAELEKAKDELKEQQSNSMPDDGKLNNEKSVVASQLPTEPTRKNDLVIDVKNNGLSTIFEPTSKTTLKPGETATIECSSKMIKHSVLNNIKQLNSLGKNVEVLSDE